MRKFQWIIVCMGCIAVLVPGSVFADSLEQQVLFTVDPRFDVKGRSELLASLRKITKQLYFYVEDEWWGIVSDKQRTEILGNFEILASDFSDEIYPTLTGIFGQENRPGIDGDERITILVHRMRDQAKGYVTSDDGYTKFEAPGSNEREMVYLSEEAVSSTLAQSYLAHEFTHLLYFYQKQLKQTTPDEVWIQEGFAEVAPTLLGYDNEYAGSYLEKRVHDFVSNPRDSLVEWRGQGADYGVANLFFQYLVDQYGKELLREALQSSKRGIASIEEGLQKRGIQKKFPDVFSDWTIAVFLNDCSYGEQYCFHSTSLKDLRVVPFTSFLSSFGETQLTVTNETKNWAGNWHKISGGKSGKLEVRFEGNPSTRFVIPYLIQDTNNQYQVGFLDLTNDQKGILEVSNFGTEQAAVIILPSIQDRTEGFDEDNPSYLFSWTVSTSSTNQGIGSSDTVLLLEQIEFLQNEVAKLQKQLRLLRGEDSPVRASGCRAERNLFYGMRGQEEVKCLQEFLKAQGTEIYPEGFVTGNFLSLTHAAVIRFQERYAEEILRPLGLEKGTGFVGPATRKKINELIRA